jgi:hypothetical protein
MSLAKLLWVQQHTSTFCDHVVGLRQQKIINKTNSIHTTKIYSFMWNFTNCPDILHVMYAVLMSHTIMLTHTVFCLNMSVVETN